MSLNEEQIRGLTREFMEWAHTTEAEAYMKLKEADWDLQTALHLHFRDEAVDLGLTEQARKVEEMLDRLKSVDDLVIVSWNIDGLDEKYLEARTEAVIGYLKELKPAVVFLQEVVEESKIVLRGALDRDYQFIDGGRESGCGYFTVTLVDRTLVKLDSFQVIQFPGSKMGRNVSVVECAVGNNLKLTLMNSHLESTRDHRDERKSQLKDCFNKVKSAAEDRVVIFGGDLNMREAELREIGGIPDGVVDLWEAGGSEDRYKYTWDMTRNDNLKFSCGNGKFKPQCRFDRLYLRNPTSSTSSRLRLEKFANFGYKRISNGNGVFPSDHWAISAQLKIE